MLECVPPRGGARARPRPAVGRNQASSALVVTDLDVDLKVCDNPCGGLACELLPWVLGRFRDSLDVAVIERQRDLVT